MARLKILFTYQWTMYMRCLEVNSLRKAERLLASWMAFVIFIRYFVNTCFIISSIYSENAVFAQPMLEFNLLYVGIILVIGPFLLRTVLATGYSFNVPRLLLASVSPTCLFIIKVTEIIFRPSFIIMFICSLFSVSLFIFTRMPVAGIVSGILYVVFCISVSLFLATIGADAMENRTVKGASSLFLVVFALLLINLNYSFLIDGDGLYTWIGASRVLLWNKSTGGGLLSEIRPFAPSSWVMSGMTGYTWLFILALFALCIPLLIAASRLIYIRSMEKTFGKKRRVASVQRRFKPHPFLSRQNGTIFQKHLYQIICEPLYIFCFAASVIGGIMLFQKNPVLEGTIVSIVLILIVIEGRLFFNIFGYETFSLDRYRLAPVSGLDILKAKNAALFVAMSCQYAPFFIMSLITLNVALAVNLLFISGIVWLVYTMWGNVSSLLLVTPAVMMDGTSPSANDKFINVCVSIAPLLVINYVKDLSAPLPVIISVTAAFISLIVCTVVYKILIARQGRYLESKMEEVVLELSKQ